MSLPLVEVVGFEPVYVACAAIPLLALVLLLTGVYSETGAFMPNTERTTNE